MRSLLKRRPLELKPLELPELIRDSLALVKSDAQTRHVKINLEIPEKLPVVPGDRVHIQQVLLILMLNAMDAMAKVPADERALTVRGQVIKQRFVQVAVVDCGTGIPADRQAHLFEPFYTTKPDGMGMGLAIAQTIIEAHGGTIQGVNNSDRGATFQFTLEMKDTSP